MIFEEFAKTSLSSTKDAICVCLPRFEIVAHTAVSNAGYGGPCVVCRTKRETRCQTKQRRQPVRKRICHISRANGR